MMEVDETSEGSSSNVVAEHYNTMQDKGLDFRNTSRILYLRNFNNWIKSMLLGECIESIQENKPRGSSINAMDLCCGKGGDLLKWKLGNVNHLVCVDIAEISIADCKKRYSQNRQRTPNIFSAEFLVADVTKESLTEKYRNQLSVQLDVVSCQFAFHYCFESLKQAKMMLKNVTDCLKPGGYFIGTMPNAFEIVARQKTAKKDNIGNSIFNISFDEGVTNHYPIFGAKYNFHLEGVVDCPEYLVHFPTLEKLASMYGLKCVKKKRFQNYFEEMRKKGHSLLGRMSALETYPPLANVKLVGRTSEYRHAKEYMKEFYGNKHIGTLSMPEWEVASLYMVFVFQKVGK
ncbi:unnamed protein product [Nezara viridula]|uniref:mRNA cap guanine-N(7) methyltransferase n=1 Tax=Nezara viridula TaxID=85310 RepID=A0A9P0E0J2_NEZVI|nr:unnamed protein product [Nezara viridula]